MGAVMGGLNTTRNFLASTALVLVLGACSVTPQPLTEADMRGQAQADRVEMYKDEAPVTKPLTLPDAIARALTFNLDRRTKVMEEALAAGQKDLDRWDMLPKLAANAGYTSRSEANATRSRDAVTQTTSTSNPTYSTDRDNSTADLGLTWNILDLGVSYVTAHQNADKALIATERRRKTVHNLIQEVRFAYWRTAAAQVLEHDVRQAVATAEQALVDARAVEREGLKSPADILRYQKNLLETLRQLEAISQELSTARVELAALVNLPPGSDFVLEIPDDGAMTVAPFEMAPERMEELAFINNPDLREQVYLSRIAVDETKKTILKLLPGINLNLAQKWDSNSFLVDHQWHEVGAKITWNIFNLLSAPAQMDQAEAGERVANAKRVALRMAVLAQTHVALRQYLNAGKQFQRADELYQVETRLARFATIRADNDAQSAMERIANQTSAIAARLRRYQSYAQMESAYGKMQATLGQDLLPETVSSRDLGDLSAAIAERLALWRKGHAEDAAPALAAAPAISEPQEQSRIAGARIADTGEGAAKPDAPAAAKPDVGAAQEAVVALVPPAPVAPAVEPPAPAAVPAAATEPFVRPKPALAAAPRKTVAVKAPARVQVAAPVVPEPALSTVESDLVPASLMVEAPSPAEVASLTPVAQPTSPLAVVYVRYAPSEPATRPAGERAGGERAEIRYSLPLPPKAAELAGKISAPE